jgi:protein TonB
MTESTVRAERFEPQSSATPSYTWAVPQKPLSVRFPFPLIDRLEHEAVESFRSLHSRGSEIGGLLLGRVSLKDPAAVSIEDYEPVVCDYSRGPLYRLSDADMGRLERAIEQRRAAGGLAVVGFFRSHTRKGLALDADDLALFKARFADPRQVALLIRPFATKASTAGIFIWEDGAVRGEASHLEFPFRSSELTPSKPFEEASLPLPEAVPPAPPEVAAPKPPARGQIVPIASRREIAVPVPPPIIEKPAPAIAPEKKPEPAAAAKAQTPAQALAQALAQAPAQAPVQAPAQAKAQAPAQAKAQAPAPVQTQAPAQEDNASGAVASAPIPDVDALPAVGPLAPYRSVKVARLAVAAAVGFVAIVLLFIYPGFLRHSTRPPVAAQQDSSPLALHVEQQGGEQVLTWNRDSNAIKNATHAVLSITDGAQHENVDMDLALLRSGSIEYQPSGSDVVFRMEVTGADQMKTTSESVRILRTRPSPMPEPVQQSAVTKSAPAAPVPAKPTSAPSEVAAPDSASSQPPPAQAEARPATPAKQFNPESLSIAQRLRPVRPTDMPDAPEVGRAASDAVSAAVPVGVSAMPAPQLTSAPAAPVAAPGTPVRAANTTAARTNPNGEKVQPAQLITRKDPEYPQIARQSGAQGEVVVTATIGLDGKVKNVKVESGHPLLRNAAIAAVKQWVYRPTLLNGKPVESESRISLNFVPR